MVSLPAVLLAPSLTYDDNPMQNYAKKDQQRPGKANVRSKISIPFKSVNEHDYPAHLHRR